MLDVAASTVTLEIPVVRLPQTKRVAALRAALMLSDEAACAARFCLRLDLLVLRFVARLDALLPSLLRSVAREMAGFAVRAEERFALAFDARPAIPEQGVLSAWDRAGRAQALPLLAPPSFTAPASQAVPPPVSSRPVSRSSSMRPPGIAPPPARPITLRLSIPPVLAAEEDDDDMPAILAPDMAAERPSPPSIPPTVPPPALIPVFEARSAFAPPPAPTPVIPPPPETPVSPRPPQSEMPASARPSVLPSALPHVPALGMRSFPSTAAMRAVSPSEPGALPSATANPMRVLTPAELEAPPATRRPLRAPQDSSTPEGRLCELIRQALSLATLLSFHERPHTMLLLVRAAVFRAVHEHFDTVPNAVVYLYRATRAITREIWTTRPDPTRPPGPIPLAEPALSAMEQIVTARGTFPREKPVSIDGWTTAQQAKEQLAKYVVEIEISPTEPPLRHYLALGALSELLVRTRLPPQTDQRLRDIVAFAQRDGAKPHVIELMMTALRKIVSG